MKQIGWYKYVDDKEADFGPPLCGKPMEVHASGVDWLAFNCRDCHAGFNLSREYYGEGSGLWWAFAVCSGQKDIT